MFNVDLFKFSLTENTLPNYQELSDRSKFNHKYFVLSVDKPIFESFIKSKSVANRYDAYLRKAIKGIRASYWRNCRSEKYRYIISGTISTFNDIWASPCFANKTSHIDDVCQHLDILYNQCFDNVHNKNILASPNIIELTDDELNSLPNDIKNVHKGITAEITLDKDLFNELRSLDFLDEKYNTTIYKSKTISFLIPSYIDISEYEYLLSRQFIKDYFEDPDKYKMYLTDDTNNWLNIHKIVYDKQISMILNKVKFTAFNSILPGDYRIDIKITNRINDWKELFINNQYNDNCINANMVKLYRALVSKFPNAFKDISYLVINKEDELNA